MHHLEPLDASRAQAVLDFERANRGYFAATVSDRGDAFFADFDRRFRALLDEQDSGQCRFFVLVGDREAAAGGADGAGGPDGAVLGRFNLYDIADGSAEVGYRVAERVAGRGTATAALRALCRIATELGLHTLSAATADDNVASQRVLARAGFEPDGPARPADLGGRTGTRYRLRLDGGPEVDSRAR